MKSSKKTTAFIWVVLIGIVVVIVLSRGGENERPDPAEMYAAYPFRSMDVFVDDLEAGMVTSISTYRDDDLMLVYTKTGDLYRTPYVLNELSETQLEHLSKTNVEPGYVPSDDYYAQSDSGGSWFLTYLLILGGILFALWFFFKRVSGGTNSIFEMRRSKVRILSDYDDVKFQDVGGCHEAKEELKDVVDFLNHPERWLDAGVRLPRGILLEGPPGCGKTLLARAVAGESSAKFLLVSASEFVEMFVGVGAARVRDMFEQAAKEAPAIVFIDELDAVGRKRGSGIGAANDEREQTLNQILVSLDGFEPVDRVFVLAATNRADILDKALLRPGRFGRRLLIPLPSREDRIEILKIHSNRLPLADDLSLEELADRTEGQNGAQLENLVNEAALLAVRRTRQRNLEVTSVRMEDFEAVFRRRKENDLEYNQLDSVLIESVSQFAAPSGKAIVRMTLVNGDSLEGTVKWMDAVMVKVLSSDNREVVVAKNQIAQMEPLDGTGTIDAAELRPDPWLSHTPDLA